MKIEGNGRVTAILLSWQYLKNFLNERQYLETVEGFLETHILLMILCFVSFGQFCQQPCSHMT